MNRTKLIREAMKLLRAIPSEARSEASRKNGKKGGRPKNKSRRDRTALTEKEK
jgi:hypothetical protein